MNAPRNPYTIRPTVAGANPFIGRRSTTNTALQMLGAPGIPGMVIHGQRKIGKTVFLTHLKEKLRKEGGFAPVYCSLEGWSAVPLNRLLTEVAMQIERQLDLPSITLATGASAREFQTDIFPEILSRVPPLLTPVLMFDDMDRYVGADPSLSGTLFYPFLQRWMADCAPRAKFIITLGRTSRDYGEIAEPLFGELPTVTLSYFNPEETAALARLSEKAGGLHWPNAQIAAIRNLSGGHPALTLALCHAVWEITRRTTGGDAPTVSFKDTGKAFSEAVKAADPLFLDMWESLDPREKMVISALADENGGFATPTVLKHRLLKYPIHDPETILESLRHYGIIRRKAEGFGMGAKMFARWVMAKKPLEQLGDEIHRMADRQVSAAQHLFRSKQLPAASALLSDTLQLVPAHAEARLLLARISIELNQFDPAIALLEKVNGARARRLYYDALMAKAGQVASLSDQKEIYRKILSDDPRNSTAQRRYRACMERIGDAAAETGELQAALSAYREAGLNLKARSVEAKLKRKPSGRKKRKQHGFPWRLVWWFLGGTATAAILVAVAGGLAWHAYREISKDLPQIHSLRDYHPPAVTAVYAADGQKIGEFFRERRFVIPLSDMPLPLIQGVVAAEDSRFFTHQGVDLLGIVRAFFKNIEAGTVVQGGSTITQQVVKSFLLSPERSYERKAKEAILAHRIDQAFTKSEILFLYLNQIYLGHGAYGVEAAAENYFGKPARDLSLAECALLAGMAQAPGRDSPFIAPERAKRRQHYVLTRMVEEGYLTADAARRAFAAPLTVLPRQNLFLDTVPYFTEHVRREAALLFGEEALYTEGFRIFTTVDPKMQQTAHEAVAGGLEALEKRHRYADGQIPQGALLCMETGTGRVRAMVGGREFTENQFNRAVQALRQPGSAFKPIIYAAAIDHGFTPATILDDSPFVMPDNGKLWKPTNYDNRFYGPLPLRTALAKSRNLPVVKVLQRIGPDYAVDYAHRLGITADLFPGLSLALGASGVSLLEMVEAYSVFANQGKRIDPVFITCIEDRDGEAIFRDAPEGDQAIEPATAFIMTSLLRSVVENGTGYRIRQLNRPAAGKTGTTNDFRDAWFIGYTPEYVTGAWVGFDIEQPMGKGETGSRAAAPIWLSFMSRIMDGMPVRDFGEPPEGVVFAEVDADTGLLPIPESPRIAYECFKEGSVPTEHTPRHVVIVEPEDFFKKGL